ncbi:MAG TPA: VOC family protein [Planctomycetota bacterium]
MSHAEHDLRIDYIEFHATNVAAACAFYARVFGWKFTSYGDDYQSFADGRIAGAIRHAHKVVPGSPLVVIYAKDLAAVEAAVVAAGGRIETPVFAFPGGRRFHFLDPVGNLLAVWSE